MTIAIAAAALFAFRETLISAGIPDFRHDWRWPFLDQQLRSALPDVLRVWSSSGLGVPHALVVNHPALWIVHWLSFLLPVKTVLAIGIVGTVFLTGCGVASMARALRVNYTIATCAGIVAALGPPMFDKFVAGHWYYMVSIAAAPWAIASALRYEGKSVPRAAATGAVIALTALQVQLWLATLAICVAVFAAGAHKGRRSMLDIAVLAFAGSTLAMPELYGAFAAHSAARYAALQTIPLWESNNSAPFFAALVGLGYAPGYAESALAQVPWARICLWLVPIGACAGAIVARRERKAIALAAAWLVLLSLVSGLDGPFAIPLKFLYARFIWASTFRELQHFAEPMWISAVVLSAIFAGRLDRRAGTGSAAVAVLGALALWVPPHYGGTLRSWDFAGRSNALFSQPPAIASRYLLTPSIQPVGPPGTSFRGADPDAAVAGSWFPENDPEQFGMVGVPLLLGERDPNRNAGWLRAAGINAVLHRPYLTSGAIENSALSEIQKQQARRFFPRVVSQAPWREAALSLLELRQSLPVVRDPFTARFQDGFLLERAVVTDAHDPDSVSAANRGVPLVSRIAWNPANAWVGASYWWWLDPQIAFWPDAALTWSNQPLRVPEAFRQRGYVHVVVFAGVLLADRRAVRTRRDVATWVALRGAATLRVSHGAAMIVEFANVSPPYRPVHLAEHPDGIALQGTFDPDCACGAVQVARNDRWLVLKQSYDESWRVTLDRGRVLRHVLFAGYGNAWQIEAAPGSLARVEYAPAASWQFLVQASIILWLFIAAAGVGTFLWAR